MNTDDAPPASLAELIELDVAPRRLWRQEELGAVLLHELSLPVRVALAELELAAAERFARGGEDGPVRLLSLGALLHHPNPPLQMLELVKAAAKHARHNPQNHLPEDVAAVLYAMAIAAALLRHGRHITTMSPAALMTFLRWADERPWLDPATRELLAHGLHTLAASPPSSAPGLH